MAAVLAGGDAPSWLDIGPAHAIPPLGARTVRAGGTEIAVFRTAQDAYYALENRCPHKEGPLAQGIVHGRRVTCPLHNWVIGLDDGRAAAPDEGCVRRYRVRVEGGRLLLGLEPLP
jgi:nitrite reductase (NADH) small subunit